MLYFLADFSATQSFSDCNSSDFGASQHFQGIQILFDTVVVKAPGTPPTLEENMVIMIIQIQGGTINNGNNINYGNGRGVGRGSMTNTAGQYEFNIINSNDYTVGDIDFKIQVKLPFQNTYIHDDSGNSRFQVVVVPLCNSATINQRIDTDSWDGHSGGIFSLLAFKDILIMETISSSEAGFRGANTHPAPSGDYGPGQRDYATKVPDPEDLRRDAYKAEGYIGSPTFDSVTTTYPGGLDCAAGAPGNAGGGGTIADSGGGGGGNGGLGGDGGTSIFEGNLVAGVGGDTSFSSDPNKIYFGKYNIVILNC